MPTEAWTSGHISVLRLFRTSNDAPPSTPLVCNYAGRAVVAQPGAKPEGANGTATGLKRALCQKGVLDLMTRCSSQTFYRDQPVAEIFPLSSF